MTDRMRGSISPSAQVGALLIALTATGCGRSDGAAALAAVADGSAQAALQRRFDAAPECAPVLGFSHRRSLLEAADDNAAAAALVAAGLLEPVTGDPRPHWRNYRPAPAARRWFRNVNPAEKSQPYLCFARRVVRVVSLVPDDTSPTIRYTFSLQDPPPWMARADMIAAFPGVALSYDNVFAADEVVRVDKGRIKFDPFYTQWSSNTFYYYGINFIGYTYAELVDPRKIAILTKKER